MTPAPLPITATIVTYHSDAVLPACVAALPPITEIIVVDNAGTAPLPGTRFLQMRKNLGFGRGHNRALAHVHTPYVLVLNPDAVLAEGALAKMLATLETHKEAGLVAPLLLDEGGTHRRSWRLEDGAKPIATPAEAFTTTHIPAAVWLLRTEAFRKIGGFDRRFFMFYEDDDVCLRLRQAGYSLLLEPTAHCLHLQGKSSTPSARTTWIKQYHYARSALYFTAKHQGKAAVQRRRLRMLGGNLLRLLGGFLLLNREKMISALARLAAVF